MPDSPMLQSGHRLLPKDFARRTLAVLLAVVCFLMLINVLADGLKFYWPQISQSSDQAPPSWVLLLHQWFNLNDEQNIPTWFSSALFLINAVILWIISRQQTAVKSPFVRHWAMLSLLFVFLSMDEAVGVHEHLVNPVRRLIQHDGAFRHAWTLPYMAALLLLGCFYLRFMKQLPATIRRLMGLSALIYLAGAAGMEVVEGLWARSQMTAAHIANMGNFIITTVEEVLEMVGLSVCAYALLRFWSGCLETSGAASNTVDASNRAALLEGDGAIE